MEKTDKNEMKLKSFFEENKIEISNNGFSEKVMKQLPENNDRKWIVWMFAALGLSISLLLGFNMGVFSNVCFFIQHLSIFHIAIAVFIFPLISIIAICSRQSCSLKLA